MGIEHGAVIMYALAAAIVLVAAGGVVLVLVAAVVVLSPHQHWRHRDPS